MTRRKYYWHGREIELLDLEGMREAFRDLADLLDQERMKRLKTPPIDNPSKSAP